MSNEELEKLIKKFKAVKAKKVFSPHIEYAHLVIKDNEKDWVDYRSYESHTSMGDDYDMVYAPSKKPVFYEEHIWEDCFCWPEEKELFEEKGYKIKRYPKLKFIRYEEK